ncbi:MAG: LicD family protein [Lactobacillus delbrueckii]|nr:LicD family protein [Lactobacillus delbrueckii]MDY5603650.1 LicD family protein [Lactobacillus delbrueckii]
MSKLGTKDGFAAQKTVFEASDQVTYVEGEDLKKLKATLLEMLQDWMRVCDKYQLNYTLSGGSVLGTIRHQGFIPWDDDIDINMPRRDFNRLKEIFSKEMGDKYRLLAPELTKGHGNSASRFVKKDTVYRTFSDIAEPKEHCGICIDIFVLENTPNNAFLRNLHGYLCLAVGYLLSCRKVYDYLPKLLEVQDSPEVRAAFGKKYKIGRFFAFLPLDTVTRWTYQVYSACKNDQSKYVTIPSGRKHYFGEMDTRENMCESQTGTFEGMTVKIPKGIESYMTRLYGPDYMTPPPVAKREKHPLFEFDLGEH